MSGLANDSLPRMSAMCQGDHAYSMESGKCSPRTTGIVTNGKSGYRGIVEQPSPDVGLTTIPTCTTNTGFYFSHLIGGIELYIVCVGAKDN